MADVPASLSIRSGGPRGRSLHATQPFAPGALIAAVRPPVLLPAGEHADAICNYCLSAKRAARRCTRCRAVAYCRPECQRADWARMHARECRVLQLGGGRATMAAPSRALLQALVTPALATALGALEGNIDHIEEDRYDDLYSSAYSVLAACNRTPPSDQAVHDAAILLAKIHLNAFDRTDEDTGLAGMFVDPTLAMANHSCIPNAVVQCTNATVYLRAEMAIAAGDEVEISYIDYTLPFACRQEGLQSYSFRCQCARCAGHLSVYQVCQMSSSIALNEVSLVADLNLLANPAAFRDSAILSRLTTLADQIFSDFESNPIPPSQPIHQQRATLARWFTRCASLVNASLWALQPLPQLLTEALVYYSKIKSFDKALAVAALTAIQATPFQHVAPFHVIRVKGYLLMAKLLSNTAAESHARRPGRPQLVQYANSARDEIQRVLSQSDQVGMCEVLLLLILRYGPLGHASDSQVCMVARDLLDNIHKLSGREQYRTLIGAWSQHPSRPASRKFLQDLLLTPLDALASAAVKLLQADFIDA